MIEALREHPRLRFLPWALAALALGAFIAFYRGPGWRPIRFHGGDVVVVAFMYYSAGLLWPAAWRARAVLVGVIAFGVEVFQSFGVTSPDDPLAVQLTVGSTFDPWDLLAYVVGIGIAVGLERRFLVDGRTRGPTG